MFKISQKYDTFLGNEVEETFRFNFTETELLKLAEKDELFNADILAAIIQSENTLEMYKMIRKLVLLSYGVLSEDGKHFRKTDQIRDDFEQSAAFDPIIDRLVGGSDTNFISEFIVGIFPSKFANEIKNRTTNITSIEDLKNIQK